MPFRPATLLNSVTTLSCITTDDCTVHCCLKLADRKFNEAVNLLDERTCCSRVGRSSRSGTGTNRRRTEHRLHSDTTSGIRTRSPVLQRHVPTSPFTMPSSYRSQYNRMLPRHKIPEYLAERQEQLLSELCERFSCYSSNPCCIIPSGPEKKLDHF